jgi:hypothetical protein
VVQRRLFLEGGYLVLLCFCCYVQYAYYAQYRCYWLMQKGFACEWHG